MGCLCTGDDRIHDQNCDGHKRRTCTDTICLALFTLFWGFLIFIAIMAFVLGDPMRLIKGTDSFGNVCGRRDNVKNPNVEYSGLDMSERRYVFFMDQDNLKDSLAICVKQCPNKTLYDDGAVAIFHQTTGSSLCRYDFDFGQLRGNDKVAIDADRGKHVGPCPSYPVYASKSILNRCVPKNIYSLGSKVVGSIYGYFNSFDTFKQVVADLTVSWQEVLIMTGVSIVLSLIVVFLVHFFAHVIALILLICVSLSMIILSGVFWWTWIDIKYKLNLDMTKFFQILDESYRNERTFLVLSIITTVVTVILILICLVMRKRVKLVVALFHEAGACIRAMPGLLFQPFWTFLILSIFVVFWLAVILAIATADYQSKKETPLTLKGRRPINPTDLSFSDQNNYSPSGSLSMAPRDLAFGQSDVSILSSIKFDRPTWIKYMWWYAIIAFIWSCEFILGCQQMVIAGAVGSWYFCRDRSNLPCPVGRSIRRLVLFHMGSVAFGSFLITLLKIPRIIIAYVEEKLKQYDDYAVIRGMLKCCGCCLYMLENFLQYLNRNAYSVTAIRGTGFCASAQIAFTTIASNALRVATINSVGDFILFLGKCTVTAITAILTTVLLKVRYPQSFSESLFLHPSFPSYSNSSNNVVQSEIYPSPITSRDVSTFLTSNVPYLNQTNDSIHFYAVPLILVCVLSYFVAHCILSVYEVSNLY